MATKNKLICGDCAVVMRSLEENSVDSIVSDPPYGLEFMGKNWDYGVPGQVFWKEALRIAKPGTHLLAFGGTRTFHRLVANIEDAGWELRDCLMWLYGSGFPKGRDLEAKGADGWKGWNTTLKPSYEPIILARKPVEGQSVTYNIKKWGTGGVNVDACRIGERWPANVILDKEAGDLLDMTAGREVARYFYCPKPSNEERDRGLDDFEAKACGVGALRDNGRGKVAKNTHPTVKPVALMRYLVRLVTPPTGVVLDPFCGSGSTLLAAKDEGFHYIGIDIMQEYIDIAAGRLNEPKEEEEERQTGQTSLDRWF